jgi:hypothetical protein
MRKKVNYWELLVDPGHDWNQIRKHYKRATGTRLHVKLGQL